MEQEYQSMQEKDASPSLKALINQLKDFFMEILISWKLLAIFVSLTVAFFLYKALSAPTTFPAKLSFMVNEDSGGNMNGVNSILGSFGLGGTAGEYNLEKMLQLSKTLKIIKESAFEKVKINGKNDFIANHIINTYDYHDKWKDDTTGLKNFYFQNADFENFSRTENKALKKVYTKVVGNSQNTVVPLLSSGISEDTGIMKLSIDSETEMLSIFLVKKIYEKLSQFYVKKTVEKQKATYDIVKAKVDSIKFVLQKTEYSLADFKDSNLGIISKRAKLKELQLEAKVTMLYGMLGEAIKNLEVADFSLKSKTPVVQIIDAPFPPIYPLKESKIKAILIGGFLGGVLGVAFISARKVVNDALNE